jgi:hypothetical protein
MYLSQRPSLLDLLGSALRAQFKETTAEQLPKRWVELIEHFNSRGRAKHPARCDHQQGRQWHNRDVESWRRKALRV